MKHIFPLLFSLIFIPLLCAETYFPSRTDFRDESIYFVMTTRFYDGDLSNNVQCWDGQQYNVGDPAWRGDFKGLIEKLDYIKALGFTAIWITPVVENASGYDYHGYHALDFSKVDRRYESEGVTLQTLVDEVHARGMKIIVDIVLQHTGNFGEANLCKLFNRDWSADQSSAEQCMVPFLQSDGGRLPDDYVTMQSGAQYSARLAQMKNTDGQNNDIHNYWHHYGHGNWDDPSRWWMQIAGDCVDLNTEHPAVYNYLIRCYTRFIEMGVDGFRIDTGGHIPRLTFNKAFIPAFHAAAERNSDKRGGFPFFMFTEVCSRYTSIWYREQPNLSPLFYTWGEGRDYAWDDDPSSWDGIVALEGDGCNTHVNHRSVHASAVNDNSITSQPVSDNAFLKGNDYHEPDYSRSSGLSVIDFTMHHSFVNIGSAWSVANPQNDKYYNDALWNVVYVDSHDYAPNGAPEDKRFSKGMTAWAENLALMFTFRGIPCLYYGSEIEFKSGCPIDKGPNMPLRDSGRAYFGGYIKGGADVSDFAEYSGAYGNLAQTLSHPLARHIQRLNLIRMAVPALRKGQYSVSGCSGSYAFKRRYTDDSTDSYALVSISGGAVFSDILNGIYVDCVTGERKVVTDGRLSVTCSGAGNIRVYVLDTKKSPAPGKVGEDGMFIYGGSKVNIPLPLWDGTEEELVGVPDDGAGDDNHISAPCLESHDERSVFFSRPKDFSSHIYCYIWYKDKNGTTEVCGRWPGLAAQSLGGGLYKYVIPEDKGDFSDDWMIIWNDGGGCQTRDLKFHIRGYYYGDDRGSVDFKENVSVLCSELPEDTLIETLPEDSSSIFVIDGVLHIISHVDRRVSLFGVDGTLVRVIDLSVGDNSVYGLNHGVYIVDRSKVVI